MNIAPANLQTKNHFQILDGLRGVAAFMVVIFHMFEAYANENRFAQIINHGYLAVDFFFLLSGFVVAYACDDRWERMSQWEFYKRRLIRLQPMVVMSTMIGAALFYPQHSRIFPLITTTPALRMLGVMLISFTMIPLLPSMYIRGCSETAPLNGPAWSLLYEYFANILYAIGLRRLPVKALAMLVFCRRSFSCAVGGLWSSRRRDRRLVDRCAADAYRICAHVVSLLRGHPVDAARPTHSSSACILPAWSCA